MSPAPFQAFDGEQYLERIGELRDEIRLAMAAIAGNRLQALQESLWRQELLCASLRHQLGTAQRTTDHTGIAADLRAPLALLHQTSQSYADLIGQVRASNHLLLALCQSCSPEPRNLIDFAIQRYSLEA